MAGISPLPYFSFMAINSWTALRKRDPVGKRIASPGLCIIKYPQMYKIGDSIRSYIIYMSTLAILAP